MAFSVTLSEAATGYGFDDFAGSIDYTPLFGTVVSTTPSWGPDGLAIGQFGTIQVGYSTGISAVVSLSRSGSETLSVQQLALKGSHGEALVTYTGLVTVNANNILLVFQDEYLLSGNDFLLGNSSNNLLQAYAGNDRVEGGGGTDTAVYSGRMSAYSWTSSGASINTSGIDGMDTLVNVERLRFDDFTVAFDIAGVAGQAYRLYQAAFDRGPDAGGLGYWIDSLDDGRLLRDAAAFFASSPEFLSKYGALSNEQFAAQLYMNVLHRAPDAGGLAYWAASLDQGSTRGDVLVGFSESAENQANVIGAIQGGIVFI